MGSQADAHPRSESARRPTIAFVQPSLAKNIAYLE